MTRAFSIRIPDKLLADAKTAAAATGESFTAYVEGALVLRMLGSPSLLDQPMNPVLAPRDTCAHPFRDDGRCRTCGEAM